jgi:hypothetical protein
MQSDESEKERMDSTRKNLFENLTKSSEDTLGAGATSEDNNSENYTREEEDFCDSQINPSSRGWRSGYNSNVTLQDLQQAQDDNDIRWKDAAVHKAKLSDFNARVTKYKTTSAGASSMPVGLTPLPDPTRTQQEASAQVHSVHGSTTSIVSRSSSTDAANTASSTTTTSCGRISE